MKNSYLNEDTEAAVKSSMNMSVRSLSKSSSNYF